MKVILLSILVLAIVISAMAAFIFLGKRKRFPDTHISHNKEMRKRGISCAQHESMGCKPADNMECGSCCGKK
ncbi:MAG: hypothetical protein CVU05_04825 [Bacteroidetes bacterium HGW-Bacteroidetes-21]|jgi:hypothetical protein|nr:MAG: hypothetical protein CVU05_04825 [Bacteroidetes bacterium HGW-Bacteroidetes-21]